MNLSAVFDTNVLISGILWRGIPFQLLRWAEEGSLRIYTSLEILAEIHLWKPMHLQPVFNPQITQISRINSKKAPQYDLPYLPRYHLPELQGRRGKQNTQNKDRYKVKVVGGEVAEDLFDRGLCLPSGTVMTNSDLDRVIDTILNCRKKRKEI